MRNQPVTLDEHLACLRSQGRSSLRAVRSAEQMLERFIASDRPDSHQIDQLRSQTRAAMRSLRLTNQLLARAAQLLDQSDQPQEAHHGHASTARLG